MKYENDFRFELTVRVEIEKVFKTGGHTGERLSIVETLTMPPGSFLEAAGILGRFHDLAEQVKVEKAHTREVQ